MAKAAFGFVPILKTDLVGKLLDSFRHQWYHSLSLQHLLEGAEDAASFDQLQGAKLPPSQREILGIPVHFPQNVLFFLRQIDLSCFFGNQFDYPPLVFFSSLNFTNK